jgi:hypothetical protein
LARASEQASAQALVPEWALVLEQASVPESEPALVRASERGSVPVLVPEWARA